AGPSGESRRASADEMMNLSLVDDAEVVQAIETSRLVQHVMPLLEDPVSELDALVSSAMGLETVQADRNPVRPEVFAQTLRELFGKAQVKSATGSIWLKYLADPLGTELQQLYGGLVAQLKDANVQAAGYGRAPGARAGRVSAERADDDFAQTEVPAQEGGPAPAYGSLSSGQISRALLRDFLFHGDPAQTSQAPSRAYYAEVEQELAQLRRHAGHGPAAQAAPVVPSGYQQLPPVDRPARPVSVHSTLSAKVWGGYADSHERSMLRSRLRQDVTQMSQVLGLELVREVVDRVARDPRLLAPVREAIVALEPSLLRLAMVDPRFFSDERHPGRLLMEIVAQRSFKYNDEFSAEFIGFFAEVSREFNALNQRKILDTQPFEAALHQLEADWARQDISEEARSNEAMQAVRFAEQRHALAEQIAWDLRRRPDLEGVPDVVQDFLFGPWSLVLAQARLTDTRAQSDPGGYLSVISDLLWSVKREVTLRRPAQLFARVPPLLAKLREGLALLGPDPAEHEAFFQDLMKLHHPVLKLRRAKSRRDARESGLAPLGAVESPAAVPAVAAVDAPAPGQPWMSPRELDAAGFQETLPTDMSPLAGETGDSGPVPLPQPEASAEPETGAADAPERPVDVAAVMGQLREGSWVDLYSKRNWHRARLIWASARGTLFMFVSHGGRPHSMTKRICERLIASRYLRPVHSHEVVAHALDTLEQEAPA
ncbi:MAG TPA: DUF1631 family protein, partial [Ramlibacter sp.]|nr:DUF1631 family protein [Ramlibacter sp.]